MRSAVAGRNPRRAALAAAAYKEVFAGWLLVGALVVGSCAKAAEPAKGGLESGMTGQVFTARGVVQELGADGRTVTVSHEAIGDYMAAMTMPFRVKEAKELSGLHAGDQISFRLRVAGDKSWIEGIVKLEAAPVRDRRPEGEVAERAAKPVRRRHPLMDFKFTNELGQAVSLGDFRGQALAITFFFTRCPLPEFCPRLSKNFQEAEQKLGTMAGAPTNWHFLSVSFDTEFDTPEVLRAYGKMYAYDSQHWSFLTGPAEEIGELARLSDVTFQRSGGSISHNFRTLIIDARGRLQMVFPTGGNLSDDIVSEILKAARAANGPARQEPGPRPPQARPPGAMARESAGGGKL